MIDSIAGTRSFKREGREGTGLQFHRLAVTILEGPDQGRQVLFDGPSVRIGSAESSDLRIPDGSVSRKHLLVTLKAEGANLQDLGSKNGTWFNGARVGELLTVKDATIQIGAVRLRIQVVVESIDVHSDTKRQLAGLVTASPAMYQIFDLIEKLARHDPPVMILGETGTGKEALARALHFNGPRRSAPFQVLDCGSLPSEILASQLFGHEKGAFTGADERRAGIFEEANGGTVVLDEVAEIPLSLQPALLRVLESKEVTRLGSRKAVSLDFRIVSSTNRDLKQMVQEGQFRSDLYYRLAAFVVRIPPLKTRSGDIVLLANHFLDQIASDNVPRASLSKDAQAQLTAHAWPGNVRELRNLMQTLAVLADGSPITGELVSTHLQPDAHMESKSTDAEPTTAPTPGSRLKDMEREAVLGALESSDWNVQKAAKKLGIARNTVYMKMEKYGLKRA